MRFRKGVTAALAVGALGVAGTAALADEGDGKGPKNGKAIDTEADFTPFERFTPLASSTPCVGEGSGRQAKPFVIPPKYQQQVVAEEGDPGLNQNSDNWDMNTQNEFGKDAGRYVYRPHENRDARAGQVSLTDLKTGRSSILAERADWEAFDGIVWTPQGTILANEEVTRQAKPDPNVPQASGGLVYEFFVDENDPSRLDPSREPITPGDGTNDTTRDGIRARPALGAKAHEGMRFDKRGFMYGIAESRGQSTAGAAGAIFRFIPDRKGDLSRGQLQALVTENRRTGEGRWVDLDRTQVQIDADAEAEKKGANEYQRPEDLETGESTGKDRNNGGNTVYVSLTEGAEEGVLAIDVSAKDRPFAYPYAGTFAGNNPGGFNNPDNLALDSKGNLAIAEDPPTNPVGADVFVAAPPRGNDGGGKRRQPARTVQRFSSLKDCAAEPSGIYFALKGTEKFSKEIGLEDVVNGETLFDHRQHAGETTPIDSLVAIVRGDEDDRGRGRNRDDDDDRGRGRGRGRDRD
jgi:hypothetical protein